MAGNDRNKAVTEKGSSSESDSEIDANPYVTQIDSESSAEKLKSEVESDADDVLTVVELSTENRESEHSSTDPPNIVYEFPDDSEFCDSIESFSNLRKRPSDTTIEQTSKKSCKDKNGVEISNAIIEISDVEDEKNASSETPTNSMDRATNNKADRNPPFSGGQHNTEGDNRKLEIAENTNSHPPSRFTKHKGDTKCHHGTLEDCVETCSEDEADADVEDNAEDSNAVVSENSSNDSQLKKTLQNTIKDIVKRHIKPAALGNKTPKDISTPIRANTTSDATPQTTTIKQDSSETGVKSMEPSTIEPTATDRSHQTKTNKPKTKDYTKTKGVKFEDPSTKTSSIANGSHQVTAAKKKVSDSIAKAKTKGKMDSSIEEKKKPKKTGNSNKILGSESSSNSEVNKKPKKSVISNKIKDVFSSKPSSIKPPSSKPVTSSSDSNPPTVAKSPVTSPQKNKRRCGVCDKKLKLTDITCRCGGTFCPLHRYDREHNCTFDYKAMGAEEIRKNNPKIVGEKVKKI